MGHLKTLVRALGMMPMCIILLCLCFTLIYGSAVSAQVLAPNMSSCNSPSGIPSLEPPLSCCAPLSSSEPKLFVPSTTRINTRRPAHKLNATEITILARAYELIKALPDDDPRSFFQQANIHCAYCNAVYNQLNSTQLYQSHGSWLFFPFHRLYLYFHERILQRLLQDDTFTLPFWNYDHPEGSTIPWMYVNVSSLSDTKRDPSHLRPPAVVGLDYNYNTEPRSVENQLDENIKQLYRVMIRDADTQDRFFGMPFRHGDSPARTGSTAGTIEEIPHATIHVWVGSPYDIGSKDMGAFYSAARDPIFYPHHAEIDRIWELWKQLSPDHNKDISDPDFLESEMFFYNEDAELVRVKMADALSTEKLGYVYEDAELPWIDAAPAQLSTGPAKLTADDSVCDIGKSAISEKCSVVLQRSEAAVGNPSVAEHLMLVGIEWILGMPVKMDIFLNYPSASVNTTAGSHEYVDTFMIYPQFYPSTNSIDYFSYNITKRVLDLDLTSETSLIFTFVPHGYEQNVSSPLFLSDVVLQYPDTFSSSGVYYA